MRGLDRISIDVQAHSEYLTNYILSLSWEWEKSQEKLPRLWHQLSQAKATTSELRQQNTELHQQLETSRHRISSLEVELADLPALREQASQLQMIRHTLQFAFGGIFNTPTGGQPITQSANGLSSRGPSNTQPTTSASQ